MRKITKQLLKKSVESFLLALELFNKPTVGYRTESFAILFTNAWELLMKAYIFEKSDGRKLSIFRRKKPKQRRESITLDESLVKIFQDANDPVKRNIEYISEIRNTAVHLVVADLDPYFSRVFQAGVINYLAYLQNWFEVTLEKRLRPGLLSLVLDIHEPDIKFLKRKYNKEDFNTILNLMKQFKRLEKLGTQGTFSMKYTVAIVRNPKKADFVITTGKTAGKQALIIEKPKDIDLTHPFNMTTALNEIQLRLSSKVRFTSYDFQSYCFVKGVKKTDKNEYFWKSKYSGSGQYSQKFIDEIVSAVLADSKNISRWRSQYTQNLRGGKKRS